MIPSVSPYKLTYYKFYVITYPNTDLKKNPEAISNILMHNKKNKTIAYLLSQMDQKTMPVALGVIYCVEKPTLDSNYTKKLNSQKNNIRKIMEKGQTWTI